jgi:hypothetical protein
VFWGERGWDRMIVAYITLYVNPCQFRDALGSTSASAGEGLVAFVVVFKLVFVLEK